jgi:hypothetical protein
MLDSGTTYAYFPDAVFHAIDVAIQTACANGACKAKPFASDSQCWKLDPQPFSQAPTIPSAFPTLLMQFGGGIVPWHPTAYLYQRGTTDIWCKAYANNGMTVQTVLGAAWMLQKEVIFDIQGKRVGLVEANCPSYRRSFDAIGRKNAVTPPIKRPADFRSAGVVCLVVASLLTIISLRVARAHFQSSPETEGSADDELGVE